MLRPGILSFLGEIIHPQNSQESTWGFCCVPRIWGVGSHVLGSLGVEQVQEMRVRGSSPKQGLMFLCPAPLVNKLWTDLVLKLCRRGLPRGALDPLRLAEGLWGTPLPQFPLPRKSLPWIGLRREDCFAVPRTLFVLIPPSSLFQCFHCF